ncbi:putative chromatin-remodeling complex ATPase chain [Platanthera guangdongensis]|uniref:Chromatin-remodeling complex ATPase chain n=1 Tax=Platanthera guangdongensis TaxID=2320717 RepID=A0ABR2MRN8_9ASPA
MAREEGRPLSLNERLAMSLSRSRPTSHRCTEFRVRKVKLEGRSRLCKLSSRPDGGDQGIVFSPTSSPGEEPDDGRSSFQNVVVDGPSSRLESLPHSRPTSHRSPEIRVRKVKLEGRRRLCKLSSRPDSGDQGIVFSPASSPGEEPDDGRSRFQNVVVDDPSSRLESLSHSRPTSHRCPEIRVRKVKLEGRRRLCKLSSRPDRGDMDNGFSPASSPGEEPDDGGSSFQNIVDDLSSRLESLSVKKLNRSSPLHPPESEPEFKSANSSLSSSSSEERGDKRIGKIKGNIMRPMVQEQDEGTDIMNFKAKAVEQLVLGDDSEEDDCIFLGSGQKSELGESYNTLENSDVDCGEPIMMHFTGKGKDLRFSLRGKTAKILYPHQKEGLKWLWSLHCGGTGGILGDDMGLGKTMQISAFLAGLFHSNLVHRVLLVAPKTLLGHWIKELSVVGLSTRIRE